MDLSWLTQPEAIISLITLTVLEIVLGIDNIIFISIITGKLPESQRAKARQIGLSLALFTRVALLLGISWVMGLKQELFNLAGHGISGRDLILIVGGLFLIYKATKEIHEKLEGAEEASHAIKKIGFNAVIGQILILDLVFSLDSVITAVGMAKHVEVMILAVIIAVGFMLVFAGKLSHFVEEHPTIKMLALAFLVLIGVNLIAEGMGQHIEKGYTYFAMAFATGVEILNIRLRKRSAPVQLHNVPSVPSNEN